MMFDILMSLGLSILLAIVVLFFSATSPSKDTPTSARTASPCPPSPQLGGRQQPRLAPESVKWVGVLLQFVAWTVLGRGGGDPALWNATIAFHLDKALQGIMAAARSKLQTTTPRLQLVDLSCGTFQEGTTPAQGKALRGSHSAFAAAISAPPPVPPASPAVLTSHNGGTILPTIGAISSREYLCGATGRTVREFRVPVTYTDNAFKLALKGELPLMFGFGGSAASGGLRIPVDLATTRANVAVSRIDFSCEASLVVVHNTCELYFASSPQFAASFHVSLGGRTAVLSEPKLAELCVNAVRLGLEGMVYPKCMRMVLSSEKPYINWVKGACEERTRANAN